MPLVRFHRGPKVLGAGLLRSGGPVETPDAGKKRLVADQPAEHVAADRGALVVDERAKHAALVADVTEPVTQIDRPLVRLLDPPACATGA